MSVDQGLKGKSSLPIILVHKGNQEYLKICLDYAVDHGNSVILIGDDSNSSFEREGIAWFDHNEYSSEELREFNRIYVHMSSNSPEYERFCFERHFLIREYVKKHDINEFYMMDSDILLGRLDMESIRKYDAALCWNEANSKISKAASPHFSYWKKSALDDFIAFTMNAYSSDIKLMKECYEQITGRGITGGVCDMTLLYLWKEKNIERVCNLCGDENIKLGVSRRLLCKQENSRYLVERGAIKLVNVNDDLFYIDKQTEERIYAQVIHAQGDAKKYIKMLAKGKTDSFSKGIADIIHKCKKHF